jgi:hypothetical protein
MQQITLPCLMTWGFPGLPVALERAQPPSHPSFTDNELSALGTIANNRQLSIKFSPKTNSPTEQIGAEEFANEDFFLERDL